MGVYYLDERRFTTFVNAVIDAKRVVGPVARHAKFAYEELESAENLRLDFDVTILPPKSVFFPPAQTILRLDATRSRVASARWTPCSSACISTT